MYKAGALSTPSVQAQAWGRFQMRLKRALDLGGALAGLVCFSPVFLLIGVLLYIEAPGKVFYRQERLGRGGRRFWIWKFRTMREGAEAAIELILQNDPTRLSEYEQFQKLAQDPRLTRMGSFLRRTSLDELPQLWNVVKGEMSLVGPRPFLPRQLHRYGAVYPLYQAVPPGITGLWQISGRNELPFEVRVQLDEKYLREWSLWLDLEILLRTPWVVLLRKGAC